MALWKIIPAFSGWLPDLVRTAERRVLLETHGYPWPISQDFPVKRFVQCLKTRGIISGSAPNIMVWRFAAATGGNGLPKERDSLARKGRTCWKMNTAPFG